jgi:hypothetical protein
VAVPAAALPAELKPSAARGELMRELGFDKRDGPNRPWVKALRDGDPEALADHALLVLRDVYGQGGEPRLVGAMLETEPPRNDELLEDMRTLARARDMPSRHRVYEGVLNANFLVPLEPGVDPDADPEELLHLAEDERFGRSLPVFTDWRHLRWWQPCGWDFIEMHGFEVFPAAAARTVASVRINPDGRIGGELYAHEIDTLVQAIRRHRAKSSN